MSPPPFLLSMLEGLKTFLGQYLSFCAFWTAMPPPLFLTSMPIDNGLPLSVGALMVQDLPGDKAAMFTRSTLGFGHLGAPNLTLVVCLWPKRNGSARRAGLRQPRGPGRRNGHESVQLEHNGRYILGIYQVYTSQWAFLENTFFCVPMACSIPFWT